MRSWLIRQAGQRAATLLAVTALIFLFLKLAPGDARQIEQLSASVAPQVAPAADSQAGKASAVLEYFAWLGRIARFDLGTSATDGTPVAEKIGRRFLVSAQLGFAALFTIYLLAIPLGLAAAVHQDRPLGRFLDRLFPALYSLPAFWIGLVLMVLLCGGDYWHLFPVAGLQSPQLENPSFWTLLADRLWHLVLPVFCLAYSGTGYVARQVRSAALECLHADFILLARAKGLPERQIYLRHVLPHALHPAAALLAFFFPALVAGSVLVESLFSIPGMGQLGVESLLARDYPVLMALGLLSAVATIGGSLLVELLLRYWRREEETA